MQAGALWGALGVTAGRMMDLGVQWFASAMGFKNDSSGRGYGSVAGNMLSIQESLGSIPSNSIKNK